jgi:hypothetical protein
VELERYDADMLVRRKQIFDAYAKAFSAWKWAELPVYEREDRRTSYHVFLLRVKGITEEQRDEIIRGIFRREVSVNVHFVPLPMMTYYKNAGYSIADYPTTERSKTFVSLAVSAAQPDCVRRNRHVTLPGLRAVRERLPPRRARNHILLSSSPCACRSGCGLQGLP